MPSIKIEYLAIFRHILGKKSERIPMWEGADVESLIQVMADRNGSEFERTILNPESGELNQSIMIILNGELLKLPIDLKRPLAEDDEITLGVTAFGG